MAHQRELFVERQRTVLAAGHKQRDEKDDDDGDGIKSHRDFEHVLKEQAEAQIQDKEH